DRATGTKKWEYQLRTGISASPVADTQQIYITGVNTQLAAFYLPFVGVGETGGTEGSSPIYGSREERAEARPLPVWEETTNTPLPFQPLQTSEVIFVISS